MPQALSYHALIKLLLPEDWKQSQTGLMGLERELLRIQTNGELPETAHPTPWGSALTNPDITLDFAETQPELVAPPFPNSQELQDYLYYLHAFLAQRLPAPEKLWFMSMPPRLDNTKIHPAHFGSSNSGKLKTYYRNGLANRYGKKMQVISGVHFNFSWSDEFWQRLHQRVGDSRKLSLFKSENYLGLMRNYMRKSWLLAYLMGANPAIDRSFVKRAPEDLVAWKTNTLYGPYATSLRMSNIGYVNSSRCSASVNYNSLTDYLSGLYQAITSECPGFALIGVKNEDGTYRQLNTHLLQIENEHYSLIRAKQVPEAGERSFNALRTRGVSYVEIRAIDNQPDTALGVHEYQMDFLRLFLLYCLMNPNPPVDRDEDLENKKNHQLAALMGRKPDLILKKNGEEIRLQDWGLSILERMQPLAEKLDYHHHNKRYQEVLTQMQTLLRHPELTPSARVWAEIEANDLEYLEWGLQKSQDLSDELQKVEIPEQYLKLFETHVSESLEQQAKIETEKQVNFSEYLADFSRIKITEKISD